MLLRVVAVTLGLTVATGAWAQAPRAYDPPRLADGHPDFQGVWSAQVQPFAVERVPGAKTLVVDDDEAASLVQAALKRRLEATPAVDPNTNFHDADQLPFVNGQWRTSVVIDPPDGRAPLTDSARKLLADTTRDNWTATSGDVETRPLMERCIRGQATAPLGLVPAKIFRQIVQTSAYLVINSESDVGEARIVGIGAVPRPRALTSVLGDSIGHWEGDELVIETTGVKAEHPERAPGIVVQSDARVIERLRLIGPDELLYRFTVEHPATYDRAWLGEFSLKRSNERMYEMSCHEGNYALPSILAAGLLEQERRAKLSSGASGGRQ